ncbi:MAG: pyridoxamine 5'-phosphate oxidase family protein [Acidimicrobiaceae bacterium]|nr:pyridoxamine 5'-phosphate oxidase family protein [Acidimicrobiaceae bacterium]
MLQILDAGLIAHVGVSTPDGPLVLPMAYGHDAENLYLHGAVANHLLGEGEGQEICVTVTCVDGLVVARTPFHNSMNYRSVVVRGKAQRITDDEHKLAALKLVTNHIAEIWDTGRPPSETDLRKTLVLQMPLTESSAKVRSGDPIDDPEDMAGPWWAGVVPIATRFGPPVVAADLTADNNPPEGSPPCQVAPQKNVRDSKPTDAQPRCGNTVTRRAPNESAKMEHGQCRRRAEPKPTELAQEERPRWR